MSLSSLCAEQHEKEADVLKRSVAFSLVGSVSLHLVMLTLSQLFPASSTQLIEDSAVIELVVTAPPPEPEPAVIEETPADLSPELPTPVIPRTPAQVSSAATTTTAAQVAEPTRVESQFQVQGATGNDEEVDWRDALARVGQPRAGQSASEADGLGRGGAGRLSGGGSRQADNSGRRGSRTVRCAYCPKPNYPESALADGVEGSPVVLIDTDANGNVLGVSLVRSSGDAALDQAAIRAARGWRLETGGYAVSNIPIEIEMNIRGSRRHRASQRRGERREMQMPGSETANAPEPAEAAPPPLTETRQEPATANDETNASNGQPVETEENPSLIETPQSPTTASDETNANNGQSVEIESQEAVPVEAVADPNPAANQPATGAGATVPAETPPASEAAPPSSNLTPEPASAAPVTPSPTP